MSTSSVNDTLASLYMEDKAVVKLVGPLLLSSLFAWGLFGTLIIQVYTYYRVFSEDRLFMRLLVALVTILQASQTLLLTETSFRDTASGFGDLSTANRVGTLWLSVCAIGGLMGISVRSFYAWRIYVISRKLSPTVFTVFTSVISFASAIALAVHVKLREEVSSLDVPVTFVIAGLWEGSAALCDVMIACYMTYYLKRRIGPGDYFVETNNLVNRIIQSAVETGILTASVSVIALGVTFSPGHPFYYVCPITTLSGLYGTSLLAVLNSRISMTIRSHSPTWREVHTAEQGLRMRDIHTNFSASGSHSANTSNVVVTVTKERLVVDDFVHGKTQNKLNDR